MVITTIKRQQGHSECMLLIQSMKIRVSLFSENCWWALPSWIRSLPRSLHYQALPRLATAGSPPQLQHPKWAAPPAQKSSNLPLALLPFTVILLERTQIHVAPTDYFTPQSAAVLSGHQPFLGHRSLSGGSKAR